MDQELVFGDFDEMTQDEVMPDPGTWVACEVNDYIIYFRCGDDGPGVGVW